MSNWLAFDVRSEIDFGSEFWSRTDLHLNFEQRSIFDSHFDVELPSICSPPRSMFDLHFGVDLTSIWTWNWDRSWIFISMSDWLLISDRDEMDFGSVFRCGTDLQFAAQTEIGFGSAFRCRADLHLKLETKTILEVHFDVGLTSICSSNRDRFWNLIPMQQWASFEVRTEIEMGSSFRCWTDLQLKLEPKSALDFHFDVELTFIRSWNRDRFWLLI